MRNKNRQIIRISRERLEELYAKKGLSMQKCAKLLGTSRFTIKQRLNEYGIQIRKSPFILSREKWNKNEVKFLIENYPSKGASFIARRLHRGRSSVQHKAERMGIKYEKVKPWSGKEIKTVLRLYKTKGLKYVANKLNRTKASVMGMVRKYKLKTDSKLRKKRISMTLKKKLRDNKSYRKTLINNLRKAGTPEAQTKLSASLKKYYATHSVSKATRLKISKAAKGKIVKESTKKKLRAYRGPLASMYGKLMSEETKKKLRKSLIKAYLEGKKRIPISPKYKGGRRKDIDYSVRSSYEANFARILNYLKINYIYELKRFKIVLSNNKISTYLPDFIVNNKYVFEIKGHFIDDSEEKLEAFKNQHSEYEVILINVPAYYYLLNSFKRKVYFEMETYTKVLMEKYKNVKEGSKIKRLLLRLAKNKTFSKP
jgi:hypothetical protein